jgi:predicted ATPase
MIERRLEELWRDLQGKKPHLPHFLSEIRLDGVRGFNNLRVVFDYPVSVIAGGNTTGKSTVLFAAACAYKVPGAGVKDYVPSTLFPDYRPKFGERMDIRQEITIEFNYLTLGGPLSMRWRRAKGWNRSFLGRKNAAQPERQLYLRTLSNLSNPSEVRGVLSMSRLKSEPEETPLTPSQIEFVQQMLPFKYTEVVDLSSGNKNLLFAAQESGAAYSELQMAAGERALLRLSKEIAQLNNALVLIDEVEAGLHPWVQQLLMLHLQQLALRNDLQIIVTSHSPVVLDSVPLNGKIFLDRDESSGEVVVRPAYRDLIQNALYGRSNEMLKLLCEDEIAEGILEGVFDFLLPQERIKWESVHIGHDTGADEFPMYATSLAKFGQIQDTVFILDGDQRGGEIEGKIMDAAGRGVNISILFLPGNDVPESWVLERLRSIPDVDASQLGTNTGDLSEIMNRVDAIYDKASDSSSNIAKNKFRSLSEELRRDASEICRIVARLEADREDSDIQPLANELRGILRQWRG